MSGRSFDVGNKHGSGEATALLALAANHPELHGAARWRAQSGRRLHALIVRNVDAGGVQVERSLFYHFYVLRLATELIEWARRSHVTLPGAFVRRTDYRTAHAHHDALAVTYFSAGRSLLVDSGLFNDHGPWQVVVREQARPGEQVAVRRSRGC
jgi:hypothetical protein